MLTEIRLTLQDQPIASRIDRKVNLAAGERPAILGDQMLWVGHERPWKPTYPYRYSCNGY